MIKSIEHLGISVADLDRSIRFYCDQMGMTLVASETFEGPQYEALLGLKGTMGKVALVKSGSLQIEIFEFKHPIPTPGDPQRPVYHHGITHFCVEVSDIEFEYRRLKAAGVVFHCPPLRFEELRATYGRDPDGNVFELIEKPQVLE